MLDLEPQRAFARLRSFGTGEGVVATERTGLSVATVLARNNKSSELATATSRAFGVTLPDGPKWTSAEGIMFIGTGPGKWLAIREGRENFVKELADSLDGLASVIDQSGAIGVLRLSGPALPSTLGKGVQFDLSLPSFPAGCAAVTAIAHMGATLWKIDEAPTIDIAIARSLSDSFLNWLQESAALHGLHAVGFSSKA